MNKEEILEKSRLENKGADLYEEEIQKQIGTYGYIAAALLMSVFAMIQASLDIRLGIWGLCAMLFIFQAPGFTVQACRHKTKWDITRAVVCWLAVIIQSVLYIRDLLAVSAVL